MAELLMYPWRSVEELDLKLEKDSRISSILSNANFDYLTNVATCTRQALDAELNQSSLKITATFNLTRFMSGCNNLVLELKFSDHVVWLARIHMGLEEQSAQDLLSEITTMRLVHHQTTIPVPRIFAFDAAANNPSGYPYILMEYLPGKRTSRGLVSSVPEAYRLKVAKQIAKILLELSHLTFDRIGRVVSTTGREEEFTIIGSKYHHNPKPMTTSLEYFYEQRYGDNQEVYNAHGEDTQWNTACWILTTGLTHLIMPDLTNGPFTLCHQDLHFGNILFDDEFNISGIIDWSSAQAAPFEDLCVLPDFALFKERGGRLTHDVQLFKNLIIQEFESISRSGSLHSEMARRIAAYMTSTQSELNSCLHMQSVSQALDIAQEFIKNIHGTTMTWDQCVQIYGKLPVPRKGGK